LQVPLTQFRSQRFLSQPYFISLMQLPSIDSKSPLVKPEKLMLCKSFSIAARYSLMSVVAVVLFSNSAVAQVDRVYPMTGNPIAGKITEMRREGVVIESGSNKQSVTVDKIRRILFDGDPPALVKGRDFALDGEYEQAAEELRRIDITAIKRDLVRADAMYYLYRSEAELALTGRGDKADADRKMLAFVTANPQNIHFFRAAKTLGDLAVARGNFDLAVKYYGALLTAPVPDLKIEGEYLVGVARLRQGQPAEAESSFAKVVGANVQSTAAARVQTLAKAGQAVTLASQAKGDDALRLVNTLIGQLDSSDSEMASRIYNALGATYEAQGDHEGAVLAYLRTHLLFSGQADAHAEALSRLVELWPKVGSPERANEARQELQQRYPGWGK
jgi:tetratricopeptide (TPR) repeat protein